MGLQSDYWVGIGTESTYGTAATPTVFLEAEAKLTEKVTTADGKGYRPAQRGVRGVRNTVAKRESSGDITVTAASAGIARLLKAAFGNDTITALSGGAARQHLFTLATSDYLPSYTLQQTVPRLGATQDAYTFLGAQCSGLEVSAKAGEGVDLKTSWIARELRRDVALATASFPATLEQLTFVGADLQLAGSALGGAGGTLTVPTATALGSIDWGTDTPPAWAIRDVSLALKNNLDGNGWNLGGSGLRQRPAALKGGSPDVVTGKMTVEYTTDLLARAAHDRADLGLVLTFAGQATIATGIAPLLQFVCPLVRLDGDVPTGNGGDVITTSISFTAYQPASGELIYGVHRTLDTVA